MLELVDLLRHLGVEIHSAMHVGANDGSEAHAYRARGIARAVFVEPLPSAFARLEANLAAVPDYLAVRALCAAEDDVEVDFFESDNAGLSSSLLPATRHLTVYPDVSFSTLHRMRTKRLDSLAGALGGEPSFDLIVLDVQGAEEVVLSGAPLMLARAKAVIAEISETALYEGGATRASLDAFMDRHGYARKAMLSPGGIGDALFIRRSVRLDPVHQPEGVNLAPGCHASQSSLSPWSHGPNEARHCVDRQADGSFAFHTAEEDRPWWMLDLGQPRRVSEIVIYNRLDAARDRAHALQVFLSLDGMAWTLLHDQAGAPFGGIDGRPLRIHREGLVMRFLRVLLPGRNMLHLDKVEVFGLM